MEDALTRIIDAGIKGGLGGAAISGVIAVLAIVVLFMGERIKKFRLENVTYKRRIVGITALAAALGMGLFPPWRLEYEGRSIKRGYAFFFDPPNPRVSQIDLPQLGVQWAILGILALIIIFYMQEKGRPNSNVPHEPEGQTKSPPRSSNIQVDKKGHHKSGNPTEPPLDSDVLTLENKVKKGAELVLEYSDDAKKNFDRLKQLPKSIAQTFIEKLEEDPSQDTRKLSDDLIAAHEAEIRPYQQEKLNQALAQARELGPEAEQEFRKVVALLGDKIDANEVLARLREKFPGNFEHYGGFAICPTTKGMFEIRDANDNRVPGTLEYKTKVAAKVAIDYLNRLRANEIGSATR